MAQIEPHVVVEDPSSLCSLGLRPIIVHGFLIEHLRRHFQDTANIQDPSIRQYLWKANVDRESIIIDSVARWNPAAASARPAILLRRNPWQVTHTGIGANLMHGSRTESGQDNFSIIMGGSHTIFCIARESGECEVLAAEVYLELLEFSAIIREKAELLRFQVTEIGQMQPIDEAREHFGIPITVAYAHNHSWKVIHQKPVLNTVDLAVFRP